MSIFKNKDSELDCGNYRGISYIPVPSRLFIQILLNKIKLNIGERPREQQAGFSGGISNVDQGFEIR